MLASITPLGQRSRHSSWGVTVTAFVVASTVTGGALGAAAGWLGGLSAGGHGQLRVWLLAGAQVDDRWLAEFRGWVVGLGYGAQLGFAVVTVVPTAATWVMLLVAVAADSFRVAVTIGVVFGLSRAAPLLATRGINDAHALRGLHRRLHVLAVPVDRTATALTGGAVAAVVVLAVGGAVS